MIYILRESEKGIGPYTNNRNEKRVIFNALIQINFEVTEAVSSARCGGHVSIS